VSECVLIGGVFDPLHAGHLAYIREAQRIANGGGIVCCVSDAPSKHLRLTTLDDRVTLLGAILGSQWEAILTSWGPVWAMERYRPKAYIKGKDWEGKLPSEEVEACQRLGIDIIYTDTIRNSSSAILREYVSRCNAEKLAAFEQTVQSQKPADKPWEPVTDYSWEARKAIEGPHAQLIKDVLDPDTVLDAGCGPGHLVRMLNDLGVYSQGMDVAARDPRIIHYSITDPIISGVEHSYHTVICREVLEHLTIKELARAVRHLVGYAERYIYVTTRFTAKPHLLDVDTSDDLDPTHITLLNQDFLRTLFVLEGCRRRADLEEKLDWQKKGRVLVYERPA
jgi:cytidyltransferase-like protein